jgi:glucokinase
MLKFVPARRIIPVMGWYVGLDLGGTNLRAGLFEGDRLVDRKERPTEADQGPEAVLSGVARILDEIGEGHPIEAVGLGFPGIVSDREGTVSVPPNLPGFERVNVREALSDRLPCPLYLGNDANLFALGEWAFGAGRGFSDVMALTLGTGVGGGIISGGRLIVGGHCAAGELGHLTVDPLGPQCNCGNRGCLEAFAGGAYFDKFARGILVQRGESRLSEKERITPKDVQEAADSGDPGSNEIWRAYGSTLGIGIASLMNVLDPEVVILGGKISRALRFFEKSLRESVERRWMRVPGRNLTLKPAELGDDAALYGALVLAKRRGEI